MKRATLIFLVFLVVVAIGSVGFVTVYLGAGFSKITFAPERRRMPLTLITFDRFTEQHAEDAYAAFHHARRGIFTNYDYYAAFDGNSWISSNGNDSDAWDRIVVESFGQTADFVNAVTEPVHSALQDTYDVNEHAEHAQFVGHVKIVHTYFKPVVFVLSDAVETHQAMLVEAVIRSLEPFQGRIGFATPLEKIAGNSERQVRYVALLEFQEPEHLMGWLTNTIRQSQFALLRKHIDNLSLVVATPS